MQTIAIVLVLAAAAWSQTPATQAPKLQVLIITGQNGASHDWRTTTPVLRKILEDTGRFEVRGPRSFAGAAPRLWRPMTSCFCTITRRRMRHFGGVSERTPHC